MAKPKNKVKIIIEAYAKNLTEEVAKWQKLNPEINVVSAQIEPPDRYKFGSATIIYNEIKEGGK
jgi:hypothetical protein